MSKLSDFDLDLSVGHQGEALVNELLTGGKTVEVKTDLKWKDTGNLYIETLCWSHNKNTWYPSGLDSTKADYWAFVLEGATLLVPTDALRSALNLFGRPITCNIEPNPSKGFLIKPEQILNFIKSSLVNKGKVN
jgi:hypothetical protein